MESELKKGSIILVHGWIMLKGLDCGNYYMITDTDEDTITFSKTGIRGKTPHFTAKKVRFRTWDIIGLYGTFKEGSNNGIEVIKEVKNNIVSPA